MAHFGEKGDGVSTFMFYFRMARSPIAAAVFARERRRPPCLDCRGVGL